MGKGIWAEGTAYAEEPSPSTVCPAVAVKMRNQTPITTNSQPFSPGEGSVPALRERGRVCNAAVSLAQTDVSRDFRIFVTVFSGYRVVGVLGS